MRHHPMPRRVVNRADVEFVICLGIIAVGVVLSVIVTLTALALVCQVLFDV